MANISTLRKLVSSGFTISNRRGLSKIVGNEKLNSLLAKYSEYRPSTLRYKVPNHDKEISIIKFKLENTGQNNYQLSLNTEINESTAKGMQLRFNNNEININTISDRLNRQLTEYENYCKTSSQLPESILETNRTMDKLYSAKYKVKPKLNKDGYYETSLIDRKTDEPVKAYVKCSKSSNNREEWEIFVKNSKGEYESVGIRKFTLYPEEKTIATGFMESRDGRDLYAGIGLRLHQLTIERMTQKGYSRILIDSEPNAFPFHYKCGFRAPDIAETVPKAEIDKVANKFLEQGLTEEEIAQALNLTQNGNQFIVPGNSFENLLKTLYLKNNGNMLANDVLCPMELYGEHLAKWQELIKTQPILKTQNFLSRIRGYFSRAA